MTGQRVSNTTVVRKIQQLENQLKFVWDTEHKMLEAQQKTLESQQEILHTQQQMIEAVGYMVERIGEMVQEMHGGAEVQPDPMNIDLDSDTDRNIFSE